MRPVKHPWMRRDVMNALASLADAEYQERVWVRRELPREGYVDNFDLNIHILYDDVGVLPAPESRVGDVLVEGDEVRRLEQLDRALGPLLSALGDSHDGAYVADERWSSVVSAASLALAAMVREWGFADPE